MCRSPYLTAKHHDQTQREWATALGAACLRSRAPTTRSTGGLPTTPPGASAEGRVAGNEDRSPRKVRTPWWCIGHERRSPCTPRRPTGRGFCTCHLGAISAGRPARAYACRGIDRRGVREVDGPQPGHRARVVRGARDPWGVPSARQAAPRRLADSDGQCHRLPRAPIWTASDACGHPRTSSVDNRDRSVAEGGAATGVVVRSVRFSRWGRSRFDL